jgi:radical SAM protein with 4Fe4S-binding SPASM domain
MLKEMGDSTFCLGNVRQNSYEEIFTADILLNTLEDSFTLAIPGCSDCAFEPWCGSDPVYHHAMYGDILGRKPESDFCKRIKGIVRYLLDALQDDKVRSILTRWATQC